MTDASLSQADVLKLLSDPTPEARALTAEKIASSFDAHAMTDSERRLAEDIFRLMLNDAEVSVRQALSENLKEISNVPHDVAVSLASDVDEVALPMIEFSSVLTDEDLIAIIESQGARKQGAAASREEVSEAVSDAIVTSGNEQAVTRLVRNEGARISDSTFERVVDAFGGSGRVQDAMVNRSKLPVTVAERLVTLVSENLQDQLLKNHQMSPGVTVDLVLRSRERAVIGLSTASEVDDVIRLVKQLHDNGRLTPSIIMRALCMGDMTFFECAMARLAEITLDNARRLIHDRGELGLRALFDKAGLPPAQYIAVCAAIQVSDENEMDGGENDRERYARRMIERIMTQYDDLGVEFASDDLEYLLGKLDDLPAGILAGGGAMTD